MENTRADAKEQLDSYDEAIKTEDNIHKENRSVNDEKQSREYPAAELIAQTCREEYMRLIGTYDNIYNKVNILLVVCMAVFIAQADSFKGNDLIKSIMATNSEFRVVLLIIQLVFSGVALLLILGAIVLLCFLLKSKKMPVLNCIDLRNKNVNEYKLQYAANTLIVIYTNIITEMIPIIDRKQKKYDLSVILVTISVVLFVLEKIM